MVGILDFTFSEDEAEPEVEMERADGAYDVVAAGAFQFAGKLTAENIARWRVGTPRQNSTLPFVTITSPA